MARTAGVSLPRDEGTIIALTYIYSVGEPTAKKIYKDAGISEDICTNDLTPEDQEKLRNEVDKYRVEGDLRCEVDPNIKRLVEIGSYRGICHHRRLPARGQNTKNNARTRKGSKRRQFIK